jgi:hypothetical protein
MSILLFHNFLIRHKHSTATKRKGKSSRRVFGLRAAFRRALFLARWTAGGRHRPGATARSAVDLAKKSALRTILPLSLLRVGYRKYLSGRNEGHGVED